jgi:hypothetical protein
LRPGNVGGDERFLRRPDQMPRVERGGVDNGIDLTDQGGDQRAIGEAANVRRLRPRQQIQAEHFMVWGEDAGDRRAELSSATGHQDAHWLPPCSCDNATAANLSPPPPDEPDRSCCKSGQCAGGDPPLQGRVGWAVPLP